MKKSKLFLCMALTTSLATASIPATAQESDPITKPWLFKKCEGFSVAIQSVHLKDKDQSRVPRWLRAKPNLGDTVKVQFKVTNNSYSNNADATYPKEEGNAYLVDDPLSVRNGVGVTIKPNPIYAWSNTDQKRNFILGRGDSVTVTYNHTITEQDLTNRGIPDGPNYPISNSGTATPVCTISPGITYSWSPLSHFFPWLAGFLRSITSFFSR
ncbi:hypothetical protein [Corynebacterium pseudotuberculosis]|uniref:Secreted protein n=2 Tax=Corynebacterium pseudotuberculosis TaxID=1719 RepID=F9Y379_CORP2|nr:hypothetical protein [Corynebacterium pseudotuberculosis]QGW57353.1 hypothetical protein CPFRC_08405 [Corynebacterium pseudotuberculosis FRC41]ADL21537.1 hypothetical protein CP1002_04740 [Corynebacterium pseudotuberculosis 1002]ADO26934.1 hypothetical protein CPI19_03115 [Corynebacterium pseudotuberculosis I19]AEK49277.1 hypothetical protein CPC231_08405 [Corynebacterium pseudotuberculosis C231]AEK92994.1 Hypothetical protein CpPAT10_1669 [Corynebacterium pseudotuberculosis PAT10]